jgi:hypothetical protein
VQIISFFNHRKFIIYKRSLSNKRNDLKGLRGENSVHGARNLNLNAAHKRYKFQSNTANYYTITFKATCFNCIESSTGLLENRSNLLTVIVHSGIPKAYNRCCSQYKSTRVPKCTINVGTLDLFSGRTDDVSAEL